MYHNQITASTTYQYDVSGTTILGEQTVYTLPVNHYLMIVVTLFFLWSTFKVAKSIRFF